jgi:hypothetical protein
MYFLTRPGSNTATPLIPLDEFPDHLMIHGLSPAMDIEATHGMTHVGEQPRAKRNYVIVDTVGNRGSTAESYSHQHVSYPSPS